MNRVFHRSNPAKAHAPSTRGWSVHASRAQGGTKGGGLGLTWHGADLPRLPEGDYQAVCIGWQGPQWCRAFQRWSLRLAFSLLAEDTCVSAFLNKGNDKAEPQVGRRSHFYRAWCLANSETPRKGQVMALEVFTDPSLQYTVRVADIRKDDNSGEKPDALIYSAVTRIVKAVRP